MDWFVWPVSLRSREVRGGPTVQRRERKHLGRREAVQPAAAGSREQVLEPVPVIAPICNEVLSLQYTAKIT